MLQVVIVGDRGSGKTTFLGLLYATLVTSGSGQEDDLRFHAAYESLVEMTALFQQLMSGAFPDSAMKEGIRELCVDLGLPRAGGGILARLGRRKGVIGPSTAFRFTLPGPLDDAIHGFRQGSTFGTGRWRDALDADVVILLADSTKLAPKGASLEPGPMGALDGQIDSLFTAIRRWRARGGREIVHPVFVLSKFDSVSPKAVSAAGVELRPPPASKHGPRAVYAQVLLEPNLPRTLATIKNSAKARPRFAEARFFFSSVHTERKAAGSEGMHLRRIAGGAWEPDYSRDEYLGLLDYLAGIAAGTRD